MRLIDADALRADAITRSGGTEFAFDNCYPFWQFSQAIAQAPTIEAAPVVHGRWEKCWQEKSKHYFRCSNCNTAFIDGISGAIAPEYGSRAWRFCPNCGARMDGDGDA